MNFFHILIFIDVVLFALLLWTCTRPAGGDDLSRAMAGPFFFFLLAVLVMANGAALLVRYLLHLLAIALIVCACAVPQLHAMAAPCGVERTPVKDLKDAAAAQIHLAPEAAAVASLRQMKAPAKWGNAMARQDAEKQVYQVQAEITGYKYERDGDRDYHVVLSAPGQPALTMILEIPHPDCAPAEYKAVFAGLRSFIDSLGPRPSPKFVTLAHPVPVTVSGVLFFDKIHGQKGVAPNGVELHPGIEIKRQAAQIRGLQPAPAINQR